MCYVSHPSCIALLLALLLPASGMDIRAYNPAVHDRFAGFPSAPVMNPTFLYNSAKFTGAGWFNPDTYRQCALVTPKHFLAATHAPASIGQNIFFLGSDGVVVQRTVTAFTPVAGDDSENSDLALVTLNAAVPSTVKPFPWLNLTNEAAYDDLELMVFGAVARAGRGQLLAIGDVPLEVPGEGLTRMFIFEYDTASGDPDDAYLLGGDSGSPTFATANNQPALVGSHTAAVPDGGLVTNYDTFVPHYVPTLDSMLLVEGYRMRPAIFTAGTLSFSTSLVPAVLEATATGTVSFTLANTGAALTGNVFMRVTFAAAEAPGTISAPGCVVENLSPGTWSIRKATLAAAQDIVATATWASLPNVLEIAYSVAVESDTTTAATYLQLLPIAQSYTAWAQGLVEAGQADDPDDDGVVNLLEYAFGSPAASAVATFPNGNSYLPVLSNQAGTVSVTFPERLQAAASGLSYVVETSVNLIDSPWSVTLPVGVVSSTQAYVPAIPGFVKRTITWPSDGPRRFVRVRALLN